MILLNAYSGWDSFLQLMSVLFIFLFVLVITYAVTKWIAKYQQGVMPNKNIRVIETFRISNNKYIQIIKVGEKYLVIAVGKDTVNVLTELTEEQLIYKPSQEGAEQKAINENFQEILIKLKDKFPRK
ncbi:MAG: flagellar biosynthetic protein FliO [Lachnospiraceae bacterium]